MALAIYVMGPRPRREMSWETGRFEDVSSVKVSRHREVG